MSDEQRVPGRSRGTRARDRLIDALRVDLLGPEAPDEVLQQSPNTRYLVGMLAPRGTAARPGRGRGDSRAIRGRRTAGRAGAARGLARSVIDRNLVRRRATRRHRAGHPFAGASTRRSRTAGGGGSPRSPARSSATTIPDDHGQAQEAARRSNGRAPSTRPSTNSRSTPTEGLRIEDVADGVQLALDRTTAAVTRSSSRCSSSTAARRRCDRRPPDEDWLYQPEIEVTPSPRDRRARHRDRTKSIRTRTSHPPTSSTARGASSRPVTASPPTGTSPMAASIAPTRVWTTVIPQTEVPIVSPAGAGIAAARDGRPRSCGRETRSPTPEPLCGRLCRVDRGSTSGTPRHPEIDDAGRQRIT